MKTVDCSQIPSFRCWPGCNDCCGPVPWSKAEQDRIHAWLAERGRNPLKATSVVCPYLIEGLGCTIYEVRPFLCRLYGTVEGLRCPHGCGPEGLLSKEQEGHLMRSYLRELEADG